MNKVKIYLVKFQLVVVAFVFFSLCSISQVCAQETGENYSKAVKAALYVVKEMSDKESVAIGSIYNVVDVNGELEGYSLGYYIGDEPYGYAIYSIEKESITEFVFSQGCNNLFNELADKAKEENIDEDNLIDGIRVSFDDGWALVRASNTGPNLTLRFEAASKKRLKEIEEE